MITELLKYFAKFPNKQGVLEAFKELHEKVDGYSEIKEFCEQLPENSVIPEIKEFAFGFSQQILKQSLQKIEELTLWVDLQKANNKTENGVSEDIIFDLVITVAVPDGDYDMMEEAVLSNKTYKILISIKNHMDQDSELTPALMNIGESVEITPLISREVLNGIGWSLILKLENPV